MNILLLKSLHLAAVFALFTSLGATLLAKTPGKAASILHGVSLILVLLIGFAMLGKPNMEVHYWMVKIGLWLFIGAAPALAKRNILPAPAVMVLCLLAATCAGYLGMAKPF